MTKAQPDRPLLTEGLPAILEHYAQGFDCAVDPQLDCGEFDWFASDRRGQVAVFSVGGLGDVPDTVLVDRSRYLTVVECLVQLPRRCEPILITRRTGQYDDWLAYASVGLFGFDCGSRRDKPSTYEVLARCGA